MLSISEVLRRLDEDTDDDFDGYIDEDEIESAKMVNLLRMI